ncbi:urea ABC transporter permease subunit UrtB [Variovorax sp. CCNWLW225]|uniref:Urea ABC transporter permease subunit UrtB n=1 Tax=Variovorax beijingensis TaxID=2496117 RepID=A0ABX9ZXY1_9BURK|nr:urea ABC transporter permease subunit UrtB [Variovorax beijingensis]RSZ29231.1 urea ABC transporter permease subunit UrtB [Variovorax beijingensis]
MKSLFDRSRGFVRWGPWFQHLMVACLCAPLLQAQAAMPVQERSSIAVSICTDPASYRSALDRIVQAVVGTSSDDAAWGKTFLERLQAVALICREQGAPVFKVDHGLVDAATLEPVTETVDELPMVPTLVLARLLKTSQAEIELFSPDVLVRRTAAQRMSQAYAQINEPLVRLALSKAADPEVMATLELALAKRSLASESVEVRVQAIRAMGNAPSESTRTLLQKYQEDRPDMSPGERTVLTQSLSQINRALEVGKAASIIFSGLSYAGVLLITALGLSIVFGLLGVINLAHGEFIMIGAYATFVIEKWLQAYAPGWFDAYVFVAIPFAFVVCALIGILLEMTIIRHLYKRPLETLLATWAVSIALIKLVQILFGSQNVEFITPSFLQGGVQLYPGFFVTWNRVFAIALGLVIFAAAYGLIRQTRFGLLIRATTQRRDTARALGIPAPSIDRLAFGLGSGLAGLAGVVLTQIASVNPSMGTSFVIDAFMVVVLGGAGSLVGTAVSSLILGEVNQLIEPFHGAVAAKVAVLLLIVLIIQRRPQGLFALKTRG